MFGRKRTEKTQGYDPAERQPAIRASICTGEKTAGFINLKTSKFEDIRLISSDKDLYEFCCEYGVDKSNIKTIY